MIKNEVSQLKLFIIGNGFDLNFGLPTTLANFGDFLRSNEPDVFSTLSGLHGLGAGNGDVNDLGQWNQLEARMANLDEEFIVAEAAYSFDRQEDYPPPYENFWAFAADHFEEMINRIIHELPRLVHEWASGINIYDTSEKSIAEYEAFGRRHQAAAFITFNYTRVE